MPEGARPGGTAQLHGRRSERARLDRLVGELRAGHSSALVVRGEAGVGKSALLAYVGERASGCRVARAAGVQSEMELAFAGLHQLCASLLDHLDRLPGPQRDALATAFGLSAGAVPDRFVVGLALLNLLSEAAAERPLICLVDDAQWLDRTSAQALGFAARRLHAESVAVVFGLRDPAAAPELAALPQLVVEGLADPDARELLRSVVPGTLDARVRDRIVAETRGNPLALMELPHDLSDQELSGGFGSQSVRALPGRIEESFGRRLAALPEETRRLLLLAAAEPLGEPVLLWRAAARAGVSTGAAAPAVEAGLCEFGARVRFRHPIVRTVAYRAGSAEERRRAHAALAEATDADADPDRRAWHRAQAAAGQDDDVADELERSAARARARGGQAAAAAFLERSATLTSDPARRARRALAAAEAKHLAGSAEAALRLVDIAERGPLEELQRVRVEALRGQVATMQRSGTDTSSQLLRAARRLERLDPGLARETYRDAFGAAYYAARLSATGLTGIAAAARAAPPSSEPPSATDRLLDAVALLSDAGYPAGGPEGRRALAEFRAARLPPDAELRWYWLACRLAADLWDDEAYDALSARYVALARKAGVLALLPTVVANRVGFEMFSGDLAVAATRSAERAAVLQATAAAHAPTTDMAIAGFRGRETEVARLDGATTLDARARGDGNWLAARDWATAVLNNGLGRYGEALVAAAEGVAPPAKLGLANWVLPELVEAAAYGGRPEAAAEALAQLGEMARACGTPWILGVEARCRALLAAGAEAEALHLTAIEQLGRTRLRTELARARLLYGEWLRREGRRVAAREELRAAHELLTAIGAEAFAERARRELEATGERVRGRSAGRADDLTAQESEIARLAAAGHSNADIGARLFLSPRTVEWHLRKVFAKLDVSSRTQLPDALPPAEQLLAPA